MVLARIGTLLAVVGGTIVGHLIWPLVKAFGGAAIEEWVDHQIAERFNLVSPTQEQVGAFIASWAVPAILAILIYLVLRFGIWLGRRRALKEADQSEPAPSVTNIQKTESPPRAEIAINGGKLFEALEQSGVNRARTVRAQIKNTGESQISNGKLRILELDPPQNGNAAFLLKSDIAVGPGQQSFVDVAAYSEGTSQVKPGKWIQLLVPPLGPYLFDVPPGALPPLPHIFKLQFSELDRVLDEVYCRVSVDSGHRLHLERWDNNRDSERLILLHDAAVRFYEAAEENGFLQYECDINAPPEKRLEHIKLLLMVDDRTHLLGVQSPSTKRRPIPKSNLTEDFCPGKDNTIVGQFGDEPVYVRVCLPDADLVRVIYDYIEHYRKRT